MIMPSPELIVASTLDAVLFVVIATGLTQNGLYVLQLVLAMQELATQRPEKRAGLLWRRYADISPPISLLVPAFNEEKSIVDSLNSMLALNYPDFEVIAVNDGSTDGTMQAMIDGFGLKPVIRHYSEAVPHQPLRAVYGSAQHPRLVVVDKPNGGKSDALNAGITLSRFPIFCAVDAELDPGERRASACRAALHRRSGPDGCGRRDHTDRQWLSYREGTGALLWAAAQPAGAVPDRRVPAGLPHGEARLEPDATR